METKQEAEWTVIPETVAPPQEERPTVAEEVLERYGFISQREFTAHFSVFHISVKDRVR